MTPRRILMTADAVGGVWTYALELARGLAGRAIELRLAVLGRPPSAAQVAEAAAIPSLTLVTTGIGLEWQDRAGPLSAAACRQLRALERDLGPDLVHCNGFREAAAGFTAPLVLVAHSCVATWWRACRGTELPADWSAYAAGVRAGLARADLLVAPSRAFLGSFRAAWGAPARSRAIWNGLDVEPPTGVEAEPVILAAGRLWDEAKNLGALAEVAPSLPWPVLVAGEPPAGGVGDGVRHLGLLPRAELRRVMARAAIFAAPARYEPFGLAILEAAASGCALVLGEEPSLVELWHDAARFVPAGDPDALRVALLELIADGAERERLRAAARRRALRFGRRRMVEGYLAAYRAVLSEREVRAA